MVNKKKKKKCFAVELTGDERDLKKVTAQKFCKEIGKAVDFGNTQANVNISVTSITRKE